MVCIIYRAICMKRSFRVFGFCSSLIKPEKKNWNLKIESYSLLQSYFRRWCEDYILLQLNYIALHWNKIALHWNTEYLVRIGILKFWTTQLRDNSSYSKRLNIFTTNQRGKDQHVIIPRPCVMIGITVKALCFLFPLTAEGEKLSPLRDISWSVSSLSTIEAYFYGGWTGGTNITRKKINRNVFSFFFKKWMTWVNDVIIVQAIQPDAGIDVRCI